jgi:hypothetical protein
MSSFFISLEVEVLHKLFENREFLAFNRTLMQIIFLIVGHDFLCLFSDKLLLHQKLVDFPDGHNDCSE